MGKAVVYETDAIIAGGLIGALDVDFVFFVVALVGWNGQG